MDEYAEIYFLDDEYDDFRNASRDHRSTNRRLVPARVGTMPRMGQAGGVTRPTTRVMMPVNSGRTVVTGRTMIAEEKPSVLGNLTSAELVALGAKVLAAIQPLPMAPVATGKVEDDAANLITYQGALALHAKRDEQLRTVGDLLAKVLG